MLIAPSSFLSPSHPRSRGVGSAGDNSAQGARAKDRLSSSSHGRRDRRQRRCSERAALGLERSDHQHGCQCAIRRGRIPRPAGPNRSIAWNLPRRAIQLEFLRVLARGQARHRATRGDLEVLLRDLLDLLRLPPRLLHDRQRCAGGGEPGAGLRLHLHRHPGHAPELDQQHRPQCRVRHPRPRLSGDLAVQRLLGQPPPRTRTSPSHTATTWDGTG